MKKLVRQIILLFLLSCLVAFLLLNAFIIQPNSLRLRYETISSPKIPKSLDNYTIVFFSDLHYNNFTTKARAQKAIDTINSVGANTVIFLGDLYDHPTHNTISPEIQNELAELLSQIEAKNGKFAILGNHDYESEKASQLITQSLIYANFEVIINGSQKLYSGNANEYIQLIALDSYLLGNPDIPRAFKGIDADTFNLLITHCPDIYDDIDTSLCDLVLAGHSHGGQVFIPLIESYFRPQGALVYFRGKYFTDNQAILDITNGVGTTQIDVRFNAPAEIVVYRLIHEE